jgi:ribosome-associated protein
MVRDVPIRGSTIRLGQLLKLAGLIDTGARVKAFLSTEPVWVNGETATPRPTALSG